MAQAVVSAAQEDQLVEEDVDAVVGSDSDLVESLGQVGQSIQVADHREDNPAQAQQHQAADRILYQTDPAAEVGSSPSSLEEGNSEAERGIHRDSRVVLGEAEQDLVWTSSA